MGLPENIDALLVKYDISQETLARVAGVSPSSVTRWRNGAQMRREPLERICRHFGLTEDDLLSSNIGLAAKEHGDVKGVHISSSGHATVPLTTLCAVHAGPFSDPGITERLIDVPASLLEHHPRAQALVVEGDCMSRVAPPGLCVVYDPELQPWNGAIVIVETENYTTLMRRWYRGSGTLMLVADSYSDGYEDIVLREEDGPVTVIGTVVWVQSAREMRES